MILTLLAVALASDLIGRQLAEVYQVKYKKLLAHIRKWWRVMKGPPPRKHGVIPIDYEPHNLPIQRRYYRSDYSLMLRPGRANRFNPRPSSLKGEAVPTRAATGGWDVSIHALHR